jgi:hypothetical protein
MSRTRGKPVFVRAHGGAKGTTVYYTQDDRVFVYSGGSFAWRNTNPGNLENGKAAMRNGSIGVSGRFAVFANYEEGFSAMVDSLRLSHGERSLSQMIQKYAPPHENDTAGYLKFLRKETGVTGSKKILEFTPKEFENLTKAIARMEGFGEGTIQVRHRITMVRKNRAGTIEAFHMETVGWISKDEAIALTLQGRVDAIVTKSRAGNFYLRGRIGHDLDGD